jgi:hypothetical protein
MVGVALCPAIQLLQYSIVTLDVLVCFSGLVTHDDDTEDWNSEHIHHTSTSSSLMRLRVFMIVSSPSLAEMYLPLLN